MKQKNSKPKKFEIVFSILFIVGMSIFISYRLNINRKIDKSNCTTVGRTIIYTSFGRSGTNIKYEYFVNGIRYENEVGFEKDVIVPNGKYLVKYLCDDFTESTMYFDEPM